MTSAIDYRRLLKRFLTVLGLLLVLSLIQEHALAFPPPAADRVFGQPDFTTVGCNTGGVSASSLCGVRAVAVDAAGNLYVAEAGNNRVVEYDSPLTTDRVADRVFGQPNFTTVGCNTGGVSASSLCIPIGVALDAAGRLYVADGVNARVLVYFSPLTTDRVADVVIGQPDFTSNTPGPSATRLTQPRGVALDAGGNLYVGDTGSGRVLEFDSPLTTGMAASRVFGQPDFTSFFPCTQTFCEVSARTLTTPVGVGLDAAGNLYVVDQGDSRVLVYLSPLTTDAVADRVIGQPDFTSFLCNTGGVSANSLCDPRGLAIDAAGNLYVADEGFDPRGTGAAVNSRVLEYDSPLSTDLAADRVFGQPNFTTFGCNNGGLSASSLCNPEGVAVNSAGNLFVADRFNHRVLEFNSPLFPIPDADGDRLADFYDACPNQNPGGLDADHNGCVDTLPGLRAYVVGLAIDTSVKNGLLGKLDEVQKALNRGNTTVAINKLHDFIDQVEGHREKALTDGDADVLRNYANNLISTLI